MTSVNVGFDVMSIVFPFHIRYETLLFVKAIDSAINCRNLG